MRCIVSIMLQTVFVIVQKIPVIFPLKIILTEIVKQIIWILVITMGRTKVKVDVYETDSAYISFPV